MTNLSGTNLNNGAAVGPQGEGRDSPSNFPKYPAYKDSGVEWLEKVPAGWTVSKLGYFFREPPCYGVLVPDFDPDGVPMLRITDMEHEFIDASGLVTISPSLSAQYARTIVQVGDVVLSLVGTIGKAFEISPKLAGVNLSRAVARIQLGSNTLPRYLCWIFQSCEFTHFIDLVCKGTAQRVLNLSDLNAFSFTFPSYSEQCAISRFLDHETARIDALIEEQQRLIELLKEKRQAVISHAVTKGLDPTAPMKDSGVEWLGEVPAHWEVTKLSFITSRIGSGKTPSGGADAYVADGVTFIRSQNVYDEGLRLDDCVFIDEATDLEMAWSRVRPLDVLINITGASIGRTCIVPEDFGRANVNQHVCVIRLSSPKKNAAWVSEALKATPTKHQVDISQTGAAREGLNFEQLAGFWICVPPLGEMAPILAHIRQMRAVIGQLLNEAEASVNLLKERRSALISAAVTGKIDVRGWQPPASTRAPELAVAEAN